ncbi:MAG: CoB--CoM heterodisulfide reductase iron-sulfur subunit B family protein [Clostridia bacterium]|nr:CoB--CoM heterodisulfide reductase iron-sulfur subunit B family protein [Clostridia bacterium]
MKVTYFPGCTLRNKAKQLDHYAREVAAVLGIELCEPNEWQCCGGVFINASDEIAGKLSSVRLLQAAKEQNTPLVTICSACHNVIKQTNHAIKADSAFCDKVNCYLAQEKEPKAYHGEAEVLHYLELLRDHVGFEALQNKVKHPLTQMKIAPYYGCLLLRPSKIMQFDDPENPTLLENLIKALGGQCVPFPMRNECCGAYTVLEDRSITKKKSETVIKNALAHGADVIVTACPLCKYNLERIGGSIPIVYFTELMAQALGIEEAEND